MSQLNEFKALLQHASDLLDDMAALRERMEEIRVWWESRTSRAA